MALLLGVVGLLQIPRALVHPLTVTADSDVDAFLQEKVIESIEAELFGGTALLPGQTRYLFKVNQLEERAQQQFPSLKEVAITTRWFSAWEIRLKQRLPFGTHCSEVRCMIIDSEGTAVQEVATSGIGITIQSRDGIALGEHLFGEVKHSTPAVSKKNFLKLEKIVQKLEAIGVGVAHIALRRGSYDVYVSLNNGVGVWIDTTESVHDITKALHVVFLEIPKEELESLRSIVICDPHGILWTSEVSWEQGCRSDEHGTTE